MAESARPLPGRIFISYRREETAYPAGWLFDRLGDRFGGQVFKDVDSIELGDDFVEVITSAVGSCDVLLALIGDQWLTIEDEDGRRRLDDTEDFVRLEIEAALTRNVRVIPILVDGARMPRASDLPPSLAKLVRRQALELSPARFDFDTSRLLKVLDKTLAEVRTAQEHPAATSVPADQAPDLTTTEPPTAAERQQLAEPNPTHGIPPAATAAPTGSSPAELNRPLHDSTTEIEEVSEQPKSPKSRLTTRDTPAPPATHPDVLRDGRPVSEIPQRTGETGPPPDQSQPSDKPRRRPSRRVWILAGAGVAALILIIVYAVNSGKESIIFQDDFSSRQNGWPDAGSKTTPGSHYQNDAYRLYAEAGSSAGGAPESATAVYPSAPPSIKIEVGARRISGSPQTTQYGILCRLVPDTSWYAFEVENKQVTIWRRPADGNATALATGVAPVRVDGTNKLSATCDGDEEGSYVYLEFFVNDKSVAKLTDKPEETGYDPLPAGSVALYTNGGKSQTAMEVEFDNFVVRKA
jgi:hypothetical protein